MNLTRAAYPSLFFHSSSCRSLHLLLSIRCLSFFTKPAGVVPHTKVYSKFPCTPLFFLPFQHFSSSRGGGDRMKEKKKSKNGVQPDRPKVILDDDEMERVIAFEALQEACKTLMAKIKVDLREQYNVRLNPRQIEALKVTITEGTSPVVLADIATVNWNRSELVVNLASMPSAVKPVLRALHSSGLNLNPQTASAGNNDPLIYIPLPKAITTEHRRALVKAVQAVGQVTKNRLKDRHFQKQFYHNKEKLKGVSADLLADVASNLAYYIKEKCREVDVIIQQKVDSLDKGN